MFNIPKLDEENRAFKGFVECFFEGASLQDIYVDSNHGYAAKKRTESYDPEILKRKYQSAKCEFLRIFHHMHNIVNPVEKYFALRGKRVLDFGCGTGSLSIALAQKGAKVIGVDPTFISLRACQFRAKYFEIDDSSFSSILVHTSPGLPFKDQSFDIIITNSVMEFIPHNRDKYILYLVSLLKSGGLLIVSTENGLFPFDYYTWQLIPYFRRKTAIEKNLPYGLTYFELLSWVKQSTRKVRNISVENKFNSIDKLVDRRKYSNNRITAFVIGLLNRILKNSCRIVGFPSDIVLPYTTFIFEVE